jgi:trans-aconitate methyltransferase
VPKAAERLVWAVDTLEAKPNDQLLEIGCGHGVAVSLVCEKLKDGHIIAIDHSTKMITMAKKRNVDYIAAGKASFQTVALIKPSSVILTLTKSLLFVLVRFCIKDLSVN